MADQKPVEGLASYLRYVALVGMVALVTALSALLVRGQPARWIEIVGGVGLLLLAVAALAQPSRFVALLTRRQTRYGSNAALMIVAFVAIVGLLNFLGNRYHLRWDVTEEKQFSLSEQTLSILRSLKEPVHVKLFFTPAHFNRQQAQDMIQEYDIRSDQLDYEFIDPDVDRRRTVDYQISRDGTIVFERGERREITFGVQEQDLTSALLKVTRDRQNGVSFLTGHQERDPKGSDQSSYSLVRQTLENENYVVNTINLAATSTIPEGLDVLVIAAPAAPLADEEIARLHEWVDAGVSLLVLVEPGSEEPLAGLLVRYGLELPDNIIIDPTRSFFGDIASPLVDTYEFHQITKDMSGLTSFFSTARSIQRTEPAPDGWTVQSLALTSESAWAETGYRAQQVAQDADELAGPLTLAVAVEPSTDDSGRGRLVVVGDAHFAEDNVLSQVRGVGNLDLFMNAIGWLAEDEALISIRPVQAEERQVVLTPPQARGIIYSNILFVPALVLAAGAIVWWRRR